MEKKRCKQNKYVKGSNYYTKIVRTVINTFNKSLFKRPSWVNYVFETFMTLHKIIDMIRHTCSKNKLQCDVRRRPKNCLDRLLAKQIIAN